MSISKQQNTLSQENGKLLLSSYSSKEQFAKEYWQFYYEKTKAEELYIQLLSELEQVISDDNIDNLKKLNNLIDYITGTEDQLNLKKYYDNIDNPIKTTNLVILACKHSKVEILKYLFSSDCKLLSNLSVGIQKNTISPNDKDAAGHNTFYYAIRSNNIELLDTIIKEWPDNYFILHLRELDEILSKAYEELKLRNVPLSDELEIFVENKLINLHFFSDVSDQNQNIKNNVNNIEKRIELVLRIVNLLKTEYLDSEKFGKRFFFTLNFIIQNIHILKRQLKSTYIRLPWEEIEFCLISFVSSQTKQQEINLFYGAVLNKNKILNYLENFAKKLQDEKGNIQDTNVNSLTDLPKLRRDDVVAEIINNYPEFEELYNDYQQIRDAHSLEKINDYIKLALSVNPKEREGHLIIIRVLQIMGEHLKNTLESPKLSSTMNELLLLSLPRNTREIIISLRNSLSHAYSLLKRIEIEENTNVNFFIGVQNDIKKMNDVITDIHYNQKLKMIRILIKKIIDSENCNEIKQVAKVLCNIELDEMISTNFKLLEHEKLEMLLEELSKNITDKTEFETKLLEQVQDIIDSLNTSLEDIRTDYVIGFSMLKSVTFVLDIKIDHNIMRVIKSQLKIALKNIAPKTKYDIKSIVQLLVKIFYSATSRPQSNNFDKIHRLFYEICYIAEFSTSDMKWIEALRKGLNEKGSFIPMNSHKQPYSTTKEKYNKNLALKLSELTRVLNDNALSGRLIEEFTLYKRNKKLQAVIEMLVLDIMSILDSSKKNLKNNLLFLDDNAPLLIGKCLRNHLAHDNVLVEILLTDPSIAIIVNARKLVEEDIMTSKKKIGKSVKEDIHKLEDKYNQGLAIVANQEAMFAALEEGNIEDLESCLKKGADINGVNTNSRTAFHLAAKAPNLEVIRFLLDQNLNANAKDINGQSPLHIAAAYGRANIVHFLIKEARLHVDSLDNKSKTPLHVAAQNGHIGIVEVLLRNNANIAAHDETGLPPAVHAMRNNHVNVAQILFTKNVNTDIPEALGGFTMLHEAAERGHLELVNFLLQNKADVNVKNDKHWTPLHAAALNGNLAVVNALILNGADVNARVLDGCSVLHYAVENGHEKIVYVLLKHGVNVNVVDKTYKNTPLHYAAQDGHQGILKSLLKNKANANAATIEGITPLLFAVQGGHLEIVTALLQHGVNIKARDKNNATPLHYAAKGGHTEIAELLIKNRAEIHAKNNNNCTPLHLAAAEGKEDTVHFLLKNKAKVGDRDNIGHTPLHVAAASGNNDVIELLIKNKAEVSARANEGVTPLYVAIRNGHVDTVVCLIKNNAEINNNIGGSVPPLYAAILGGHKEIVKVLIENKADVNVRSDECTPLHVATEAGYKDIVEILIASGAKVNVICNSRTPLCSAVRNSHKEIVEVLLANGADVNGGVVKPILLATYAGLKDIVQILLKHKARVNVKDSENATALHLAALKGHTEIVRALIMKWADVDAVTLSNITPLHLAAEQGYEEIVEILIQNGAQVNVKSAEGLTALHKAVISDHDKVVQILLDDKINIHIKDKKNRTALELAVARGCLKVVKTLLEYKKIDMNARNNDDWTLLHIASQESNLEMVKYLVDEGCDINARNSFGSKPIHIAAREGHKDIVKFFLSKGLSINEIGVANQALLHYAAMCGRLEVVKYLIAQNADVNIQDRNNTSPMHLAAIFGYKDVIEVLLKNGAVYNSLDKFCRRPLDMASDKKIIHLLVSTEKLIEAVKRNNSSEVENYVKAGASVNAKHSESGTPLIYAAWKGYDKIVYILLENKSNPDIVDDKGFTPLHYAAKFSHIKVVEALLFNGAVYNAVSNSGKTPLDLTVDENITSLLKLISESFQNIKNDNSKVIDDLKRIKDVDTIKAIMGGRNEKKKTLVVAAVHSKFSKLKQLKQISQDDISDQIDVATMLLQTGKSDSALNIFKSALEIRKEVLGSNNPATLDIEVNIATALYAKGSFQEALNKYQQILENQKELLGLNAKETLNTRSLIALVLHRLGRDEEAFNIFQETHKKQVEILGSDHIDTLNTQFHMALALNRLGKFEDALNINKAVFEKRKKMLSVRHPTTLSAQNNIAMVLCNQGKYEEALKIYGKVHATRKIVLGVNHADTLRTLHNIAGVFLKQKKYHEALTAFQDVLNSQRSCLGSNHPDTLNTQYNMANVLLAQQKWIKALKLYKEIYHKRKAVFGSNHFSVLTTLQHIKEIHSILKLQGYEESKVLQYLQKDVNIAASNGNIEVIQCLLNDGADVNDKDADGRTPLHYAINNQHVHVINFLLKNGADITRVTNKGNTPLHTAVLKGHKEIIEVLLRHVEQKKLIDFINAKTVGSGATSLHVAAKSGFLEVVKSLLMHGAVFNIENKDNKTPLNFAKDESIISLLKLIEELFQDVRKGEKKSRPSGLSGPGVEPGSFACRARAFPIKLSQPTNNPSSPCKHKRNVNSRGRHASVPYITLQNEIAAETTLMRRSSDGHGVHTARHLKRLDPASLRRCVDARVLSAIYQENKKTIRGILSRKVKIFGQSRLARLHCGAYRFPAARISTFQERESFTFTCSVDF